MANTWVLHTMEIAEAKVSAHSSHHTPPGQMFGRLLIGLDYIGLDYIGLDDIGLDRIGLDYVEF